MKTCHGPCDQGRKPCPTPEACEVQEPEHNILRVVLSDIAIGVLLMALIALVVWGLV
jgi:hypothetical protein